MGEQEGKRNTQGCAAHNSEAVSVHRAQLTAHSSSRNIGKGVQFCSRAELKRVLSHKGGLKVEGEGIGLSIRSC